MGAPMSPSPSPSGNTLGTMKRTGVFVAVLVVASSSYARFTCAH